LRHEVGHGVPYGSTRRRSRGGSPRDPEGDGHDHLAGAEQGAPDAARHIEGRAEADRVGDLREARHRSRGVRREADDAREEGRAGGDPEEPPPLTLVDAGPIVALFDAREPAHEEVKRAIRRDRSPLATTIPVLTEAFYLLSASRGSRALRQIIAASGLTV